MTLFWLAVAFVAGIFLGDTASVTAWLPFALALASLVALLLLRSSQRSRFTVLALLCLLVGVGRGELGRTRIGPNNIAFHNGQMVTVVGYVTAEPDTRDTGNNYVVAVQDLIEGSRRVPIGGQVEVHTAPSQLFDQGDQLQLTGLLSVPTSSPSIPYRSILANRGIYSEMSFPQGFIVGKVSLGLVGVANSIRADIANTIKSMLPEPEATFLIALLVGARSAQLGALAPVLVRTGLIHLIAISGIKVAIVAGTVNEFLKLTSSRAPRLILSSGVLISYWLVSGATVAGLRASIFWLLIFIAAWLGRPTFGLVSLGIASAVMLALNPQLLWDEGFQLTVAGTAAMTTFSPALSYWFRWMPSTIRSSFTSTFAAQVGVLPIQIASFHIASPISVMANAIVLPLVPLTMVVGFLTALTQSSALGEISYGLVHLMVLIAQWAATIPAPSLTTALPMLVTIAYYGVLVILGVLAIRLARFDGTYARGEWLVGLSAAVVGLGVALARPPTPNEISFPAPGSAMISWHGSTVLIDGGARPSVLLAGLGNSLSYSDRQLTAIVDTSPSAKNVASLLAVATVIRPGEVLDPGLEYPSATYARWRQTLLGEGVPTLALRTGVVLRLPGLTISCLLPDGIMSNPKDGAGILSIAVDKRRILYVGQADPNEQQDLAFTGEILKASMIISSVPLDPTLARATGYRSVVQTMPGTVINLP